MSNDNVKLVEYCRKAFDHIVFYSDKICEENARKKFF